MTHHQDPAHAPLHRVLASLVDAAWYRARHRDIAIAGLDAQQHFVRHGLAENRDPNPFFDTAWYARENPEVAASGTHPLLHYLFSGAAEGLDPHPGFDAPWYVTQHPEAAANPLLFHLRTGQSRGFATSRPLDGGDFQPSRQPPPLPPAGVTADVVIQAGCRLGPARECIDAVLARSGPRLDRIIVVEHHSSDPALVDWLQDQAARNRITLLRDRRRRGRVALVNRALDSAAGRDVVLLAGHVIVPDGWLDRLMAQAHADPRIASVAPIALQALPEGLSLSKADAACRAVNAGRFAPLPHAAGACVYWRSDALRAVGRLDAAAFAGPSAAIDLGLRATARGWSHLLACDTLVHHARPQGGGDDPAALDSQAGALIRARHPGYASALARHRRRDASIPHRFALIRALHRAGAPVILMISHGLGGGVRRHIDGLARRLHTQATILALECTAHHNHLSVPAWLGHPALSLPAADHDDLVAVLRVLDVSRLHIHHTLASGLNIRALVQSLGLPFDVTVHDYYAICPRRNLLPWAEGLTCGEPGPARCNACIADADDAEHGAHDILSWRLEQAWPFLLADRVLCPSGDVLRRLARFGLADRAMIAPHEANAAGPWPLSRPALDGPVLRIAVLGVLASLKGARTVAALASIPGLAIHLIGHTEADFPPAAASLIRQTGPYDDDELPALIRHANPHVIWFASTAPETYSYTLSRAIEAGLPIVATDLGAFPERLAGRPFTWLVPGCATPAELRDIFETVRRTLAAQPDLPKAPRPATADFYARAYLASKRPVPVTTRRRILVLPARTDAGGIAPMGQARLLQPLDHPAIGGEHRLMLASAADFAHQAADLIIVQPAAIPDQATAEALIAHARTSGSALVLDLAADPAGHSTARTLAQAADAVWTATATLAGEAGGTVLETRLDERLWLPPIAPAGRWADTTRILCLMNDTDPDDFALIAPALARIRAAYEDTVAIDVIGLPAQYELPPGLHHRRPSALAERSAAAFAHWLRSVQPGWHLGLAPLRDRPGRPLPLSILQYAALGLPTLASDVPAHLGSLADGAAGQLVPNTPAAWGTAIDWLLRDEAHRHALAARARPCFEERGALVTAAGAWHAALSAVLARQRKGAARGEPCDGRARTLHQLHEQAGTPVRPGRHQPGGRRPRGLPAGARLQ